MQTIIHGMDQQGPTVEHRELYSASSDKLQWKRIWKRNVCVYIYTHIQIYESLCCTAVINTTLEINYTWIKFFFFFTILRRPPESSESSGATPNLSSLQAECSHSCVGMLALCVENRSCGLLLVLSRYSWPTHIISSTYCLPDVLVAGIQCGWLLSLKGASY